MDNLILVLSELGKSFLISAGISLVTYYPVKWIVALVCEGISEQAKERTARIITFTFPSIIISCVRFYYLEFSNSDFSLILILAFLMIYFFASVISSQNTQLQDLEGQQRKSDKTYSEQSSKTKQLEQQVDYLKQSCETQIVNLNKSFESYRCKEYERYSSLSHIPKACYMLNDQMLDLIIKISLCDEQIRLIKNYGMCDSHFTRAECQFLISKAKDEIIKYQSELDSYQSQYLSILNSNLTAIPYLAGVISDYETHGIELIARSLDWGRDQKRLKKVASIREIRSEASNLIAQSKEAQYQLAFAIQMFPALEDFLSTDFNQLISHDFSDLASENHDRVRDYLSEEEYSRLSSTERNQLALDRYRTSHRKTNWQIGRDYELYVGYKYSLKGYTVDYYGSNNGLEDLGRDLIAKKEDRILIIQCKYWSSKKQIHEKHINQLYGTMVCYCFEKDLPRENVHGVLVTNITVSDTAKKFANYLGIEIAENFALGNYPCIKCNINRDADGEITYIYHLPFDQQYDSCKIDSPGEFMAMTVAEAERAGFRRAYRWHGE